MGETELKPWREMEKAGPQVSGIGRYKTRITIPEAWEENQGALLKIESTNGTFGCCVCKWKKSKAFRF